jgi:16S rRNA (cytosine967-C5)-methyltransferase
LLKPADTNAQRVPSARWSAFEILLRVEQQNSYASELLHASPAAQLSPADHGLATELVMGVLRWRSVLDSRIAKTSSQALNRLDLEVLTALRLGTYQLGFLDRIPARAAIHESVELVKLARKRSAAPFVNAVLRKLSSASFRREPEPNAFPGAVAERYAHPEWLVDRWIANYGFQVAEQICAFDQQVPRIAIRTSKLSAEEELGQGGVKVKPGEILSSARRIVSGDITSTQAFRQGHVVIQDEASQLVALLVGNGRVLDCCAAPGGKTAILAARNLESEVVAIELHPHRARLLRKLVSASNVRVVAADARALPLSTHFDSALVDAPCSGTGTLARNPEIKWRLRPQGLGHLQSLQLDILRSAAERTRRELVYSTCSLEHEENEDVIERFLAEHQSFQVVDCRQQLERLRSEGDLAWPDVGSLLQGPFLRTIPGVHPCDGFFAAILIRG